MLRKLMVGSVLVAFASACSDSTGPEDFDVATTQQQVSAVIGAFSDNPALLSLSALTPSSAPFAAARTAVALMPGSPTDPATAARLQKLGSSLLSFGSASPLALFPVDLLGKTFIWDAASATYVIDPQRTDAPADGVRLALYAVNPVTHLPLLPLDEVGYLDLTDVSTASADALRIVAAVENVTYIDYVASAAVGTSSLTLGAAGYVSNGTEELDFDLSLAVTQTSISVDYLLQVGSNSVRLVETLTGSSVTVTLTISDGDNTVLLNVVVTESGWDGDIRYNGEVAINISGTPEAPTFTRWDGTPLTAEEIQALQYIAGVIGTIFDTMDSLLGPAIIVFALGNG